MDNRSRTGRGGGDFQHGLLGHGSFDEIISLENLFLAWHEFQNGKRNKPDVEKFEFNLENNLFQMHDELKNKSYNHSEYTPFYVTDPKVRHIHKATVRDRILHHAIFRVLYPIFDRSFIYDSYSCRNGKGSHTAIRRLQSFALKVSKNNRQEIWSLKCDISKFFDSIDQGILLTLLERKIKDPGTMWLIRMLLGSFEKKPAKAIPLGNVTSQLFANVYLNELDQFAKHRLKTRYYLRYCDDFLILATDRESLEQLIPSIRAFLQNELGLLLHPKKVILRKYSHGIDFLGYVIRPYHTVLRTKTKRRMFRKVQAKIRHDEPLERTLPSYLGMLMHAKSEKVRKELMDMAEPIQ